MSPLNSNRVAWGVAVASLALWASSAQVTWGQVVTGATSLFAQTADDSAAANTTTVDIQQTGDTTITINDSGVQSTACPTQTPASAQVVPPAPVPAAAVGGQSGTFHICGTDSSVQTAIEQLVGGRGFSATLTSHGDGCADLSIRPTTELASGSSSSNLSVSLGSGRTLTIQIVSAQGATHATITVR